MSHFTPDDADNKAVAYTEYRILPSQQSNAPCKTDQTYDCNLNDQPITIHF